MEDATKAWVPKYVVISIDGGGIRGLVPAYLINYIEKEVEKKVGKPVQVCEYANLLAGTSTGGIISLCLSTGIKSEVLVDLYQ